MELQFSEWQSSVYGFPSTWKQKRDLVSHTTQTDEITSEEKGVQSAAAKESEAQTITEEERPISAEEFEKFPPSLFAFFSRVTEPVCQYLEQNCDPFTAEVFQDIGDADSVSELVETVKEYTLRSEKVPEDFIGSCLSWSKAGSQIAIGYSYANHEVWCSHKAPVSSWNILRTQNFHENIPTAEIFLPSCICSMEFHPTDSSILAVGLYSGEVALVDLYSIEKGSVSGFTVKNEDTFDEWAQKNDPSSFVADFGYTSYSSGHTLPVVSVKWIRLSSTQFSDLIRSGGGRDGRIDNVATSHCCLLTASKDGFISLWSTNKASNRLKLEKRFIVWADNLPEEVKIGNRNVSGMQEVGVTSMSCCKDDPYAMIFSTFGSYLFQGNLLSEVEAYEAEAILQDTFALNKDTLFSPAPVLLGQQEGCTVALDCSPFHRNVFLCATSDGRIFLKNLLQPAVSIKELIVNTENKADETVVDAQWSARPMMLGVTCGSVLKIYDLLTGESPVSTIDHDSPVTKLAFNKSGSGTVAVADEKGRLHIWKLPTKLISQDPKEMEIFMETIKIQSEI
ncbi:unnamed protein product [Orchesella dallaii]|uniref:WD repeat-containing protein 34 n=1 Tax=Orchesella dallaii TaxID=48710 RepID=A0ABP1S5K1_9HEXA